MCNADDLYEGLENQRLLPIVMIKTPPGEFDQNPSKNHSIVIMKPPYLIYDGWLDKLVKQMALTVADITTLTKIVFHMMPYLNRGPIKT